MHRFFSTFAGAILALALAWVFVPTSVRAQTQSQSQVPMVDIRLLGVALDGVVHSGNASAFQAALNEATGLFGLSIPKGAGCLMLDNSVSVPSNTVIDGGGQGCIKPNPNLAASLGVLMNVSGTQNVKISNLEVDGSSSNEPGQSWPCIATGFVTNLKLLNMYVHDCPGNNVVTAGNHIWITGWYSNAGMASPNTVNIGSDVQAGAGPWMSDDIHIDVSTWGGYYNGVGCDQCSDFQIHVVCENADTANNGADCATGYNGNTSHGSWKVECNVSGNHCLHLGGTDQHFDVTCTKPQFSCVYVGSKFVASYGTVSTDGVDNHITGLGTSFDECPHSCQTAVLTTPVHMTIQGVSQTITIAYCSSPTDCYASSPTVLPAITNAPYTLTYYGIAGNISGTVNADTPGQACLYLNQVQGGSFSGSCVGSKGNGLFGFAINNVSADLSTVAAYGDGVHITGGLPITTGTVTLQQGSPQVAGQGTFFKSDAAPGDILWVTSVPRDTMVGVVSQVLNDNSIVLTAPYNGSNVGSGKTYRLVWPSSGNRIAGLSNGSITGAGVDLIDAINTQVGTEAIGNFGVGYTSGGVSDLAPTPNCYYGLLNSNHIVNGVPGVQYTLNPGALLGNCL